MPTDNESRRVRHCKLEWEPSLDERVVGASFDELCSEAGVVGRIHGLQDAASQVSVRTSADRTDLDLAKGAADSLRWNMSVSTDSINARIDMISLTLEGGDWLDKLGNRGHTFAYLSRQAIDIAEGLGSDPTAAVLLRLATTFDRLAGAFGTAHEVGTAMRRRP